MIDEDKFKAFKNDKIKANTKQYGEELNEKYDKNFIRKSNQKYKNKTKQEFNIHENLTNELHNVMIEAVENNDPTSNISTRMCELHKEWLLFYWPSYDKTHHLSLVEMYTLDDRFRKHYEDIKIGLTDFLYEAMKYYVK